MATFLSCVDSQGKLQKSYFSWGKGLATKKKDFFEARENKYP